MADDVVLARRPLATSSVQAFEHEGVRFVTTFSEALGGRGDVSVYVPEAAASAASLPVVLLLHGVYDSHWAWFYKGGAHRTAARLIAAGDISPMVLACPSDGLFADGSAYLAHSGRDYEQWILRDVLSALPAVIPAVDDSSPLFLSGLSMGGFGALRLGLKHPRAFRGISAHSALTSVEQMPLFTDRAPRLSLSQQKDADLPHWADTSHALLPPFRFDCGLADPLLEGNRALHRGLADRGIPHRYEEFEGGHEWPYWQAHVEDSLRFFHAILASPASTTTP